MGVVLEGQWLQGGPQRFGALGGLPPSQVAVSAFKSTGLSVPQSQDGLMGVYSGEEFVFEESGWYVWTLLKLLWRYGLNPLRIYMWVEEVLEKFMR